MSKLCNFALGFVLIRLSLSAFGHGLIQNPPSRNWFCGAVTKPDQVLNGVAQYPVCGDAFASDFTGGYSFMSVLTHAQGRAVVSPLPQNVCGFNSETWQGRATPWDQPINWPTTNITPGPRTFSWNISWGPHFSDTDEFRYWITKPGFQFQSGRPLAWSDFEDAAFCVLKYDDANPGANPNIIPDKAQAMFHTQCNVPQRQGRHVIYAEWGRNQWTYERFHSCVDVVFTNTTPVPEPADFSISSTTSALTVVRGATGTASINISRAGGFAGTVAFSAAGLPQGMDASFGPASSSGSGTTLTLAATGAAPTGPATVTITGTSGGLSRTVQISLAVTDPPQQPSFTLSLSPGSLSFARGTGVNVVLSINRSGGFSGPVSFAATEMPAGITASFNPSSTSGDSVTLTLNASTSAITGGGSLIVTGTAGNVISKVTVPFTISGGAAPTGALRVEPVVNVNQPWYNELALKLTNTAPVTELSIIINIQKTPGLNLAGQYNTVGGLMQQSTSTSANVLTYQFTLAPGQALGTETYRMFAAQASGSGTAHPTSADTFTVNCTIGGATFTQTGHF